MTGTIVGVGCEVGMEMKGAEDGRVGVLVGMVLANEAEITAGRLASFGQMSATISRTSTFSAIRLPRKVKYFRNERMPAIDDCKIPGDD